MISLPRKERSEVFGEGSPRGALDPGFGDKISAWEGRLRRRQQLVAPGRRLFPPNGHLAKTCSFSL